MATENQPGSETTLPTNNQNAGLDSDLFARVQEQLLGESGILSSEPSNIEAAITEAIGGVETARAKTEQRIQSEADRTRGYIVEGADTTATASRASGSGGIMNAAALRQLQTDTAKEIKDLEARKQEALLANDAQAANQMSGLILQKLQFQENAKQQAFSNLLGMENLKTSRMTEERLGRAQSFTERSTMASIGLEYGVKVTPDMSIEDVVGQAYGTASAERKARLDKLLAETKYTQAQYSQLINNQDNNNIDNSTLGKFLFDISQDTRLTEEEKKTKIAVALSGKTQKEIFDIWNNEGKVRSSYFTEANLKPDYFNRLINGEKKSDIYTEITSRALTPQERQTASNALDAAEKQYADQQKELKKVGKNNQGTIFGSTYVPPTSGYKVSLPQPKISTGNVNPTNAVSDIFRGYFGQ